MDSLYQILMVGIKGYELTPEEELRFSERCPGSVILFSRNIRTVQQVSELCASLREICETPPLIAIDQEGGLVDRLRPFLPVTISAEELAAQADLDQIREYGRLSGAILATLGIDINLAPVLDLKLNDHDNALRTRYLGATAEEVIQRAGAYLDGLNSTGVRGCLKHYPGLGHTLVDSHFVLPTNESDLETLRANDLAPYRALRDQAPLVMVAHCHYPALDGPRPVPASLAPAAYRLLRGEIGFTGVAMTDDLGMAAVGREYSLDAMIRLGLRAGADMLPLCNDFDAINASFDVLESVRSEGLVAKERIDEAVARVLASKRDQPAFETSARTVELFEEYKEELVRLRLEVVTRG
jgi:beta-N-acetylhexosaminidase